MISISANKVQICLEQIQQHLDGHELYYGHGTDNSWDEACWLLETVLKRYGVIEFSENSSISQDQLNEINIILSRRIEEKKPLAYLINEAWFAGLPFYVNDQVLVPRSPIAELIANGFDPLLKNPPKAVLDLCTGSGCIGIATALTFPAANVELADLSQSALLVAASNIEKYSLTDRVKAIHADLFDNLKGRYDLIISNPPYVSQEEYASLPDEYQNEPEMGLISADNGLALPIQILQEAANYLSDDGILILEVGHSWQALAQALPDLPFLWLDFEFGGEGVCMLTKEQLLQ